MRRPRTRMGICMMFITGTGIDAARRPRCPQGRGWSSNRAAVLFSEDELNGRGYQLMTSPALPEAIAVFRLNTRAFPASANTYENTATPGSMHVTVPPDCEIHAGSGQKNDDGSTSFLPGQRIRILCHR
jgi:hypothetical protein